MRAERALAGLALAAAVCLGAGPQDDPGPDALVVECRGSVEWAAGAVEQESWQRLSAGQRLAAGDQVRTGPKSRVRLRVGDNAEVRLGSDSTIEILPFEPGEVPLSGVGLLLGQLTAQVTHAVGGETTFEVHTGTAVAGVRGTQFTTAVGLDGSARTSVEQGLVVFEGDSGRVELGPGQAAEVDPQGLTGSVTVDAKPDWRAWRARRREAALAAGEQAGARWVDQVARAQGDLAQVLDRGQALAQRIGTLASKARLARRSGQPQIARKIQLRLVALLQEESQLRLELRRLGTRLRARVQWLGLLERRTSAADSAGQAWRARLAELRRSGRALQVRAVMQVRGQVREHRHLARELKLQIDRLSPQRREALRHQLREMIQRNQNR